MCSVSDQKQQKKINLHCKNQEIDIPPFPMAMIGLDLSGPYPTSLLGNKYIVSFIDIYCGWPKAFPVPNK